MARFAVSPSIDISPMVTGRRCPHSINFEIYCNCRRAVDVASMAIYFMFIGVFCVVLVAMSAKISARPIANNFENIAN